jgi:hypothetical protein
MSDNDVNFDKAEEKWAPLIGQFMLDYSIVEDSIHHVIKYAIRKTVIEAEDITDRLEQRIKIFQRVMLAFLKEKADKEKLKTAVKGILSLKSTRNLIAHNPVNLAFKVGRNRSLKMLGFQISSKKNENIFVNLVSFGEKVRELRECRIMLSELMMQLHVEEFREIYESE